MNNLLERINKLDEKISDIKEKVIVSRRDLDAQKVAIIEKGYASFEEMAKDCSFLIEKISDKEKSIEELVEILEYTFNRLGL